MSENDPQRPSRRRRAYESAKEHKAAGLGGGGSLGVLITGLATHDQELFLGALPGVLPVVGAVGSAIWKYGLRGICDIIMNGHRGDPGAAAPVTSPA
jgi:hypothetical protein